MKKRGGDSRCNSPIEVSEEEEGRVEVARGRRQSRSCVKWVGMCKKKSR